MLLVIEEVLAKSKHQETITDNVVCTAGVSAVGNVSHFAGRSKSLVHSNFQKKHKSSFNATCPVGPHSEAGNPS